MCTFVGVWKVESSPESNQASGRVGGSGEETSTGESTK